MIGARLFLLHRLLFLPLFPHISFRDFVSSVPRMSSLVQGSGIESGTRFLALAGLGTGDGGFCVLGAVHAYHGREWVK